MNTTVFVLTCALVITAAGADLYRRRISNRITASAAVLGVVIHTAFGGGDGLCQSALGLVFGLLVFMGFYCLGGMGAGDVKLLGAVGALVGLQQAYHVFLLTGLTGGLMAMGCILARGRLGDVGHNLVRIVSRFVPAGLAKKRKNTYGTAGALTIQNPKLLRIPYAVAIAAGSLVSFWTA